MAGPDDEVVEPIEPVEPIEEPIEEPVEPIEEPKYDVADLFVAGLEQKPVEFEQGFATAMQDRIGDAVADRRLQMSLGLFDNDDATGAETPEAETGEETDGGATEEDA